MSALAGVCNWNGQPVSSIALATLANRSGTAGLDRAETVSPMPWLALQANVLRFDCLSMAETQPCLSADGTIVTWDGRLDNRTDLLMLFHHDLRGEASDAALVAIAYNRWGLDCLPRLLGDWSLALWDARHRRVVLARDYMGNRPLYYYATHNGLVWATRLEALVACCQLFSEPDETYIAGSLMFGHPPELTPFRSVRALRPGHYLIGSTENRVSVRPFWTFRPATIRYRRPEDYFDKLRELLIDSVRVRLRSARPVWSHLSGGWDSTSIVCLANALIRRRVVDTPAIRPLSTVSSTSPESDESGYIAAVEQWCDLRAVRREFAGYPMFSELLGHRIPVPMDVRQTLEAPTRTAGDHVVLTGNPGDLTMLTTDAPNRLGVLEPLWTGHLRHSYRLIVSRARELRIPLAISLLKLIRDTFIPFHIQHEWVHSQTIGMLAREAGVRPGDWTTLFGVTPRLASLAPSITQTRDVSLAEFPLVARQFLGHLFTWRDSGTLTSSELMPDIWWTHPYTHRPLIEFILAVPRLSLWNPGVNRLGMRKALEDIVPPALLKRPTKRGGLVVLARARKEYAEHISRERNLIGPAEEWLLVRNGYVDQRALARALQTDLVAFASRVVPDDRANATDFVRRCLHLEAWLRTIADIKADSSQIIRSMVSPPRPSTELIQWTRQSATPG